MNSAPARHLRRRYRRRLIQLAFVGPVIVYVVVMFAYPLVFGVSMSLEAFTFSSLAMLLLGFSNPLMLGLLAGILEFIPVAGWILAAGTILTFGFVTHAHWIWMLLLLVVWRLFMDYLIAPKVMGHELELHPLLAIFIMMIGGAVGGIIGIYLSIPLIAVARVVWRRFLARSVPPVARTPLLEPTPHL